MKPLVEALRARVALQTATLDDVWHAFSDSHPADMRAAHKRLLLANLLDEAERAGLLSRPKARTAWDRAEQPPLPRWVRFPPPPRTVRPRLGNVAWAPELAWVVSADVGESAEDLFAIQRFLGAGGRTRLLVPMRERSLNIFGDEKRLDRLLGTRLFERGRLDLEVLRCFAVAPPLVWEEGNREARALLVIENHHTWFSFCRWNAREGGYRAVVYGAGSLFAGAAGFLGELRDRGVDFDRVEYFGDLDPKGVAIAAQAARLADRLGLPPIRPATRWYDRLVTMAPVKGKRGRASTEDLAWLTAPVRSVAERLFADEHRIPQERIGWEELQVERR
ncbi:MAG: Wadjet anti-phage system protein JetD domain-containing protein [Myxococcota bacterium]